MRFADGDTAPREVVVPLVTDGESEPDETVELTLSAVRGCAAIGTQEAAC